MALINCPECNKEISHKAPTCPGCGAPVAQREPKGGSVAFTPQEVQVMLSRKKSTSHVLHLILSICTLGFWVIIWVLVALSNSLENRKIDNKIAKGRKVELIN